MTLTSKVIPGTGASAGHVPQAGRAMSLSMYSASVPLFLQLLDGLAGVIAKGEAHVADQPVDLLAARVYPDMYPLSWQVLAATEFAKSCVARLAGLDVPKYDGLEGGWEEARGRIMATRTFLKSIAPAQIDGSEDRDIRYNVGSTARSYRGQAYLMQTVIPQFTFHVTIAYAILRHNGVKLAKKDYLNG